jgi:hypothetical protein
VAMPGTAAGLQLLAKLQLPLLSTFQLPLAALADGAKNAAAAAKKATNWKRWAMGFLSFI